jgi:hypothetical protein
MFEVGFEVGIYEQMKEKGKNIPQLWPIEPKTDYEVT